MRSPVSQFDSSEARKTATRAMSSGWPMRPSGVSETICFSKSLPLIPALCKPSVSVARCEEVNKRFPGLLPAILNAHKSQTSAATSRRKKRAS